MSQELNEELKPCPFCNGEAEFEYEAGTEAIVQCKECSIHYAEYISDILQDVGGRELRFNDPECGYDSDPAVYSYKPKAVKIARKYLTRRWNARVGQSIQAGGDVVEVIDNFIDAAWSDLQECLNAKPKNPDEKHELAWKALGFREVLNTLRMVKSRIAALAAINGQEWLPIDTVMYDTEVIIETWGGNIFKAKLLKNNSLDSNEEQCDQWIATTDVYPECWTDGLCWESNAELNASDQPKRFITTPPAQVKEGE